DARPRHSSPRVAQNEGDSLQKRTFRVRTADSERISFVLVNRREGQRMRRYWRMSASTSSRIVSSCAGLPASTLRRSSGSVLDGRTLNHQKSSTEVFVLLTVSPSSSSKLPRAANSVTILA